jgi:hypothetical protein
MRIVYSDHLTQFPDLVKIKDSVSLPFQPQAEYSVDGYRKEDVSRWTRIALGFLCVLIVPLFFAAIRSKVFEGKEIVYYCSKVKKPPIVEKVEEIVTPIIKTKPIAAKGTIYIKSTFSSPIRQDAAFEFGKRLKNEQGEPIQINREDIYLELYGQFEKGKELMGKDKNGLPLSSIYLPSCLFKNVKEGGTIRFYDNDNLIELTCQQSTHPVSKEKSLNFEETLKSVLELVKYSLTRFKGALNNHSPFLFAEDRKSEALFHDIVIGSLLKVEKGNQSVKDIKDFAFFHDDEKKHGPYQKIGVTFANEQCVMFNLHQSRVSLSEIYLIESTDVYDIRYFWIMIPHKPEKNQYPENTLTLTCITKNGEQEFEGMFDSNETESFNKTQFNPAKGDRLAIYSHGQFACVPSRSPLEKVQLFFDRQGFLQLLWIK